MIGQGRAAIVRSRAALARRHFPADKVYPYKTSHEFWSGDVPRNRGVPTKGSGLGPSSQIHRCAHGAP